MTFQWIEKQHAAALQRASSSRDTSTASTASTASTTSSSWPLGLNLASLDEIDGAARAAVDAGQPLTDAQTPPARWRLRLRQARCVAASLAAADGRLSIAAAILELERGASQLVGSDGARIDSDDDMPLLEALCRLYLSFGDFESARALVGVLESIASRHRGDVWRQASLLMSRAMIAVADEQYVEAVDLFTAVLDHEPNNVAAANNRAVCLLYACHLPHAVASFEGSLVRGLLEATLVGNLCTCYDLASDRSADKKKALLTLVSKYAPDNFITQELAPKLSAVSGVTSVAKTSSEASTAAAGGVGGGGGGVGGGGSGGGAGGAAPVTRTNSISSPNSAVVVDKKKKPGQTTRI